MRAELRGNEGQADAAMRLQASQVSAVSLSAHGCSLQPASGELSGNEGTGWRRGAAASVLYHIVL